MYSVDWKLKLTRIRLATGLLRIAGELNALPTLPLSVYGFDWLGLHDWKSWISPVSYDPSPVFSTLTSFYTSLISPSFIHSRFKNHIFHKSLTPIDCWHLLQTAASDSRIFSWFFMFIVFTVRHRRLLFSLQSTVLAIVGASARPSVRPWC